MSRAARTRVPSAFECSSRAQPWRLLGAREPEKPSVVRRKYESSRAHAQEFRERLGRFLGPLLAVNQRLWLPLSRSYFLPIPSVQSVHLGCPTPSTTGRRWRGRRTLRAAVWPLLPIHR